MPLLFIPHMDASEEPTIFGEQIARLRAEFLMTQLSFAEAVGLSVWTIKRWEGETTTKASLSSLKAISDRFNIPPSELLARLMSDPAKGKRSAARKRSGKPK